MGWLMQDVCRGRSAAHPMPAWAAPADAEESDDSYLVDINQPGVAAEDLNPEVHDNQLPIS
jgi:HSP20 family molecular chaperone IbpA